jgi:hypothetical protein
MAFVFLCGSEQWERRERKEMMDSALAEASERKKGSVRFADGVKE